MMAVVKKIYTINMNYSIYGSLCVATRLYTLMFYVIYIKTELWNRITLQTGGKFPLPPPTNKTNSGSVADPEGGGGGVRPPPKTAMRRAKGQLTFRNRSISQELYIAQKWQTTF